MTADVVEIERLEKEEGREACAAGDIGTSELSGCDVEKPAEVYGLGCACGCEGSCGNELERDDGAEEEGDPAYKVTSGQIDSLIVWLKEFGQERRGKIKVMKNGKGLATALSTLDDQWLYGKMTEKQAEAFF